MRGLSVTIYKQFAKQIKCQKFYLENEAQAQDEEKWDLPASTGNVSLYIDEFVQHFRSLVAKQHTFTQPWMHTHICIHDKAQDMGNG